MKRRDLILGGAVAVGAPSLAAAATAPRPPHDPEAVEAALVRIDERMAKFLELDLSPNLPQSAVEDELFASRARLARAAARSLYFTGAFMEMEEHVRLHPGVQARMRRMQPEMDLAVDGMARLIETMTPADYRALQAELKRDPDVGLRIGDQLQTVAKEDGFGFQRRVDLRIAVDDFTRRVRAQNPQLAIEPYARKTRRIQAQRSTDAERERETRIKAGEKAFWEFEQRSLQHLAEWDRIYSARPRVDLVALEQTYPESDDGPEKHPDDPLASAVRVERIGGYLLGIGLGSFALGGVFYLVFLSGTGSSWAIAPTLVLGVTVGPGLIIAGLIVLIVGASMYAARKPPEDSENP